MQKAVCPKARAQLVHQRDGIAAFGRSKGVGVPLVGIAVAHRDEGRLAAHRQTHVHASQLFVDLRPHLQHVAPDFLGVRLGDARRFQHAFDRHDVFELDLGLVDRSRDRGRAARLRRTGHRNVAFASQQPRGGIEADPAGAGQIHLAPRVQVGEVHFRAARAIERTRVRRQLQQIARHEARRESQLT